MQTSEVLNRAADLIEERGWTQGWLSMAPTSVPLCLESALAVASNRATTSDGSQYHYGDVVNCPATAAVANYLGIEGRVWEWNDDLPVEGGGAQVIEVLRACAVIEAAREEQDSAWATYAEQVTA